MSTSQRTFIKASTDGVDVAVVPSESDRRLQELSSDDMKRMYGRGFKLLQKSGMTEGAKLAAAPIKVMVRKPREGLQDDDISGRRALGEHQPKKEKFINPEINYEQVYRDFRQMIPDMKSFVHSRGGSAPLSVIIDQVLKPKLNIRRNQFLTLARLVGMHRYELSVSEDGSEIMSSRPVHVKYSLECVCGRRFDSSTEWCDHVAKDFDSSHQEYDNILSQASAGPVKCLVCQGREFSNISLLGKHCRTINDVSHKQFMVVIVKALLVPREELPEATGSLLVDALENGEKEFPWRALLGSAADPLEEIPFDFGPPTPIHIDFDSDSDIVEVVEVDDATNDREFINLED